MTRVAIQLERGLSSAIPDQHERHMRNASDYMIYALWCEANGIDPDTPKEPYRLPTSGGRR